MNFLLPLDARPHSQRSLDLLVRMFSLTGQRVLLLHVLEEPDPSLLLSDTTGSLEKTYALASEASARDLLEMLSKTLSEAGAEVVIRVENGLPAGVIKSLVSAEQADMVVTSPGQHSPQDRMLSGTISSQLLRLDQPVTLVLARPIQPVESKAPAVFVLDGTEESVAALNRLAPAMNSSVPLVLLASTAGYRVEHAQTYLPPPEGASQQAPAQSRLETASRWLKEIELTHSCILTDKTIDEWLSDSTAMSAPGLITLARSRKDIIHRPLTGAHVEHLFLNAVSSSALYCASSGL